MQVLTQPKPACVHLPPACFLLCPSVVVSARQARQAQEGPGCYPVAMASLQWTPTVAISEYLRMQTEGQESCVRVTDRPWPRLHGMQLPGDAALLLRLLLFCLPCLSCLHFEYAIAIRLYNPIHFRARGRAAQDHPQVRCHLRMPSGLGVMQIEASG